MGVRVMEDAVITARHSERSEESLKVGLEFKLALRDPSLCSG